MSLTLTQAYRGAAVRRLNANHATKHGDHGRSKIRRLLTHVDGLAKHHLINIQRHHITRDIPAGEDVGDLVEWL